MLAEQRRGRYRRFRRCRFPGRADDADRAGGLVLDVPHQAAMFDLRVTQGLRVIVDAGVGTASDATIAMELGCDGVLMNTAIAEAKSPVLMANAMKHAVLAGRAAYLAGRMPKRLYADPSSPLAGLI